MRNAVLLVLLALSGTVLAWDWKIHVLIYVIARESLIPRRVKIDLASSCIDRNDKSKECLDFKKNLTVRKFKKLWERKKILELIDEIAQPDHLIKEMQGFIEKYLKKEAIELSSGVTEHLNIDAARYEKYTKNPELWPYLIAAWADDIELMIFLEKTKELLEEKFSPRSHTYYQCPSKAPKISKGDGANEYKITNAFNSFYSKLMITKTLQGKPKSPVSLRKLSYAMAGMIHLVGDMYQPMRMGTRKRSKARVKEEECGHDEGGLHVSAMEESRDPSGERVLKFAGNLREVWDRGLETDIYPGDPSLKGFEDMAARLMAEIGPCSTACNPLLVDHKKIPNYVNEMIMLAANIGYDGINPETEVLILTDTYKKEAHGIIKETIVRAGYTLAKYFKDIYRSKPPSP